MYIYTILQKAHTHTHTHPEPRLVHVTGFWVSPTNYHNPRIVQQAISYPCCALRQGYDVMTDPVYENLESDLGFLHSLSLVLRLAPFGLLYLGLPCGSFSFMSSATHRRTGAEPYGNVGVEFVNQGNLLCCRCCLLALIAIARSACWMLENPLRSAIPHMPPIQHLLHAKLKPLMIRWIHGCTEPKSPQP